MECVGYKKDIKISIIVPVYKVPETYLRNCIESLINQEFEDYEIILIDDGSPDQCGEICDEYKKISNKIQVIHKENEGVSVARNCGLEVAAGSYIMFVDGDDAIRKNALGEIYDILEKQSADISLFKYFKSGEFIAEKETKKVNILNEEQICIIKKGIMTKKEMLDGICVGSPWAKVFRADFLKQNNIRYTHGIVKAQDRVFMMNCLKYECSVQWVDYTYYYYNTENEMSVCKKYNENILESLLNTGSKIEEMVDADSFQAEINQMYLKFLIEISMLNIFHKDNKKKFSEDVLLLKRAVENEKICQAIQVCNMKECGKFFEILFFLAKKKCYKTGILFGKLYFKIR